MFAENMRVHENYNRPERRASLEQEIVILQNRTRWKFILKNSLQRRETQFVLINLNEGSLAPGW